MVLRPVYTVSMENQRMSRWGGGGGWWKKSAKKRQERARKYFHTMF